MKVLLLYLGSFLLGGVPFGYLVGKRLYSIDIRSKGSGNIGATNVLRTLGVLPGLIVLITDILKGAIPVIIGRSIGLSSEFYLLAGASSVLGHCFSPFLKFKGGKGVSSTFGMILAFDPLTAVLSFFVEILFVAIWRYVSLGSIAAVIAMIIILYLRGYNLYVLLVGSLVAILVIVRHRENIKRLREKRENKFTIGRH
ncbi:MAG: glycerol-3-phosphate 1-O-acyltransferase PlsY [bacterium]